MTETYQLRHGLYAVFDYGDVDRTPVEPPARERPRCKKTTRFEDECPCDMHVAQRAREVGQRKLL